LSQSSGDILYQLDIDWIVADAVNQTLRNAGRTNNRTCQRAADCRNGVGVAAAFDQ
jgi:hypothetical protein